MTSPWVRDISTPGAPLRQSGRQRRTQCSFWVVRALSWHAWEQTKNQEPSSLSNCYVVLPVNFSFVPKYVNYAKQQCVRLLSLVIRIPTPVEHCKATGNRLRLTGFVSFVPQLDWTPEQLSWSRLKTLMRWGQTSWILCLDDCETNALCLLELLTLARIYLRAGAISVTPCMNNACCHYLGASGI